MNVKMLGRNSGGFGKGNKCRFLLTGKCRGKDATSHWMEVYGEVVEEVKEHSWTVLWNWIRAGGWFLYEQKQSNANPALWFLSHLRYGAISLQQSMSLLLMTLTAKIASRLAFPLH